MQRRRISRTRLEGSKNVKRQPERNIREKLNFNEWMQNLIDRCEFEGAETYFDRENRVLIIRWAPENITIRSIDGLYKRYIRDYCSQWEA